MRITESKLRRIIKSVIRENEEHHDDLNSQYSGGLNPSGYGNIQPEALYHYVKNQMPFANSNILKEIIDHSSDFYDMEGNDEFNDFVHFCNEYLDKVCCGPSSGPTTWQTNEAEMAKRGASQGFSVHDCALICAELQL